MLDRLKDFKKDCDPFIGKEAMDVPVGAEVAGLPDEVVIDIEFDVGDFSLPDFDDIDITCNLTSLCSEEMCVTNTCLIRIEEYSLRRGSDSCLCSYNTN